MTERCWLRASFNEKAKERYSELPEEVIVMPSLNPTIKGSPVNLEGGKLLGPLFKQGMIDLDSAQVYLLDGINLGTVRSLRVERPKSYQY
jgi:metallophosphoesterase superfamily enzyme